MELTHMEYVVSALANANADGMTIYELMRIAVNSDDTKDFDDKVNAFSAYTQEPEEGQTVIAMPT